METAFYLMTESLAPARSWFPVRFFAGGFLMRFFRLTGNYLQSFMPRKKNAAAQYAAPLLLQNPIMRNIVLIAERKSQESRRRSVWGKSVALLRNRECKYLAQSCFLGAFQLKTGIDTYTLKNEVLLRNIKKIYPKKNGHDSYELVVAVSAIFIS